MWQLNLPEYNFNIKNTSGKYTIFDKLRKKFVSLTPEEWVRQNFIEFLVQEKKYPASLTVLEKVVNINGMRKRCDAVVFNQSAKPVVIMEFKAPNVSINAKTFDQSAVYNSKLNVKNLIISNGIEHFFCEVDTETKQYIFLDHIPSWEELTKSL